MPEKAPIATASLASPIPCPRCHNKMFAQCTATFTRILNAKCPKCAFQMDFEIYRKAMKAEFYNQPDPDAETEKDPPPE